MAPAQGLNQDQPQFAPTTLGDLLYTTPACVSVSENDWVRVVRWIAACDPLALYSLYDRTHEMVFTLVLRITNNPETAETLTLEVFDHVWREASSYDSARGSVIGWIMNCARRLALSTPQSATCATKGVRQDLPQPRPDLWESLVGRIGIEKKLSGKLTWAAAVFVGNPEWGIAAPGISCRLLARDAENNRVSMLVRLDPGTDYPPHRHAGREELYLLDGELMIGDERFYPGDYVRAEEDSVDPRVWSESGCTCVLMTSTKDVIL